MWLKKNKLPIMKILSWVLLHSPHGIARTEKPIPRFCISPMWGQEGWAADQLGNVPALTEGDTSVVKIYNRC